MTEPLFIDNAEDRIVLEVEAEWAESKFGHMDIWQDGLFHHIGLPGNWVVAKTEYTGETYIVTFERLWV